LVFACATNAPDSEGASSEDIVSGMAAKASDPCTAEIEFLQKDAYKSTGRSNEMWPPHTTVVLEVTCRTAQGEKKIAPFQENYGTPPGKLDANGKPMLTKVEMNPKVVTTSAPWSEMKKLVASFESCGCNPDDFLGLDTIDEEGKVILEKLMPVLTCPDGSEDELLLSLKEKRWDDAKEIVTQCRIRDGATPTEIARAASAFEKQVRDTYAAKHVCNNNALLQADLFDRFRDHHDAAACSSKNPLCFGPKMFFNPAKEVH
jgi:hypothetical protein